jgi:DNA repair exonuclease SbcCD ATPase subunit
MDTDGTVGKTGEITFCTTSNRLAADFQEILFSIGAICKIRQKTPKYTHKGIKKEGRTCYILNIRYKNPSNLFHLSRKKIRCENYQYSDSLRLRITGIKEIGEKPAQCITIDSAEQLYVTDGYVVTHNSILLDAVCFALFGKPYRKINKPQLINSINGKDMLVEINFTIGSNEYMIRRGMKPNIFEIHCNGNLINQDSATRDYQQYLEQNILKIDFKSFLQVVILGSANFVPFMQLPAQHRREIIEELLDIQVFSMMNNILKDDIQTNRHQLINAEHDLKILDTKLELTKKHASEIKGLKEKTLAEKIELEKALKLSYAATEKEFKEATAKYEELREKTPALENLYKKYRNRNSRKLHEEMRIEDLEKRRIRLQENPFCPTCSQPLSPETLNEHFTQIEKEKSLIQKDIDEIVAFLAKVDGIEKLVEDHNKSNTDLQHEMSQSRYELKSIERDIKEVKDQIASLKKDLEEKDNEEIDGIRKQIQLAESRKSDILVDQEVLQICAVLLKDGGIKARIIAQYIPVINKLINKYLSAMDFFVQFELDTSFNETIKSRYRDDFSYESFSEGEKTRIDLALLFAWRALAKLRNSMSTNLLIFDEILDSSLDGAGMDDLLKIIDQLTGETNVIVISHRDAMYDKFTQVLKFQKIKNFTRLVE